MLASTSYNTAKEFKRICKSYGNVKTTPIVDGDSKDPRRFFLEIKKHMDGSILGSIHSIHIKTIKKDSAIITLKENISITPTDLEYYSLERDSDCRSNKTRSDVKYLLAWQTPKTWWQYIVWPVRKIAIHADTVEQEYRFNWHILHVISFCYNLMRSLFSFFE